MTAALQIEDVTKTYGRTRALEGVSFEVPERSVFGLLGPNGAGKTTLFSIAADFIRADRGSVRALGIDTRQLSRLRGRVSILPQDALFQRNVPLLEQLVFFRQLNGRSRADAQREVVAALARVGLDEVRNRRVYSLSHGMVKRLGIAQAFLGEPEVILLDEPTAGLDPHNARQIRDLILDLRSRATVVVSSHNLAEIQELCDHVAILDRGKLVVAGTVDDITRTDRELDLTLSRELTDAEQARLCDQVGIDALRAVSHGRYAVTLAGASSQAEADAALSQLLQALLHFGITPRRVTEGRTLERQFLRLVGAGDAADSDA